VRLLAEAAAETTASPEAIWAVWTDPSLRPAWHPRLKWATLDGPLAVGTEGRWKPDRARPVSVRVAEVVPGRRLVFDGIHGLPVARGHYEYELSPAPGGEGTRLVHRVRLSGPLAAPIARFFGRPLGVSATPEAVAAVLALADDGLAPAVDSPGRPARRSTGGPAL